MRRQCRQPMRPARPPANALRPAVPADNALRTLNDDAHPLGPSTGSAGGQCVTDTGGSRYTIGYARYRFLVLLINNIVL